MMSNEKVLHSLGVARCCYEIARENHIEENKARIMWLMGFLHDIGYEFTDTPYEHAKESFEVVRELFNNKFAHLAIISAIKNHGDPDINEPSDWLRILNYADMTTDNNGNSISVEKKLEEIKGKYGKDHEIYLQAVELVKKQNLEGKFEL